jgi:hypothetical protein
VAGRRGCPVKLRDEHDDGLIVAAFDTVCFRLRPEPAGKLWSLDSFRVGCRECGAGSVSEIRAATTGRATKKENQHEATKAASTGGVIVVDLEAAAEFLRDLGLEREAAVWVQASDLTALADKLRSKGINTVGKRPERQ